MAPDKKYLTLSVSFHLIILLVLVISASFSTPLAVIQNTNQHDVISAVVLGDTAKSKILPQEETIKPAPAPIKKEEVKPLVAEKIAKAEPKPIAVPKPAPAKIKMNTPTPDAIALEMAKEIKQAKKKKLAEQKKIEDEMQRELLEKSLLADIQKTEKKKKKVRPQNLSAQFEKTLREQSEKSLRQQLLDEEIKLKGTEARFSQGEINKYKALILQAISSQWIVPVSANKSLYSELMIRVAPGGLVLDVQVTKSSGDPALDSSARLAVLKASPLPVPRDPDAFSAFRQFVLKVKPENII